MCYKGMKVFPGIVMNHTEFESEFRSAIDDIFKKQHEYIVDQCKHDKNFKIYEKIFRDDLCRRNAKAKDEILAERDTVIGLYEEKARDELISHESPRLQALKVAQKKIKFSMERYELVALNNYRGIQLFLALSVFSLILYIFSLPPIAFTFVTGKLTPAIPVFSVSSALVLFILKTIYESYAKSILIMQKKQLEIVEQVIELAQSHELTKV
jgi:hypothetical protein